MLGNNTCLSNINYTNHHIYHVIIKSVIYVGVNNDR